MQTAYPALNDHFCKHFNHANSFKLVDEQGAISTTLNLPTKSDDCSVNHTWPTLLKQANVNRIVVQFIGQRMLDRFLQAGFTVEQAPRGTIEINATVMAATKQLSLGDGHASPKFEKKLKQGKQCCHGTNSSCNSTHSCQD
ncbi:NifB/NifX family molybdenum-iron cluster-binding protein [Reinekea sp.]|jgi:predicted Fe-Mo cluster-binding NifX family protein|uniref:NifB/NifX family molybdenum-iron cluster-binding protein n=1 Tax=Reinekea sp. TaxID=1970455 RepID=UPI003988FA53